MVVENYIKCTHDIITFGYVKLSTKIAINRGVITAKEEKENFFTK